MSTLKVLFLTVLFSISIIVVKAQCNYTIVLLDTYGDGWNGGQVTVTVGTTPYGPYTLATGAGPLTYTFPVTIGNIIKVTYAAGMWPEENEYYIYDSQGAEIFHDGPNPTANNTIVGTAICPSCIAPTSLTATNILMNSSTLGWTSTGNLWNIQYGITGFTLGTGTIVNGLTTNSYSLTGLTASTGYSFYVQNNCGAGDLSSWAGPFSFSTLTCLPANQCTFAMNMHDLGNSWNGAGITVYQNGVNMGFFTVTGGGQNLTTIDLCNGANIQLSWTTGTYDNETSFELLDPSSNIIFSWVSGGAPAAGVFYTFTSSCVPPTCPAPSTVTATNISDISSSINWTEQGTATTWNIEYGPQGFILGAGIVISGINSHPYLLTGLTLSTTYDIYVQSDCGGGDLSFWTGPKTITTLGCPIAQQCMYILDMQDGGNSWNGAGINLFQNGVNMGFFTVLNGGANIDTVFLCDGGNISLEWTSSWDDANTSCQILDPFSSVVYSWTPGNNPVVGPFYSFTSYCTPPTCPAPTSLSATNVSDVSATLNWVEQGTATLWNIEYGLQGFVHGTGTSIIINSYPYVLTGLTPSTNYSFYIRSICGPSDTSFWAGPVLFTTFFGIVDNPSACGLQIPIPDGNCVDIPINVNGIFGSQMGSDVLLTDVSFIISHTWDADISATLESPNGVIVQLTGNHGGNGDNYGVIDGTCTQFTNFNMTGIDGSIAGGIAPFVGSFIPDGDFVNFNDNSNPNGIWVLHVCDWAMADTGSVHFVQLVFDPILPPAVVLINELDCDQVGNDTLEFVELYDGGFGNFPLNGYTVVFYNGSTDQSYLSFDLDGYTTDSSGYFVIGNPNVFGASITFADNLLQNGADAVALYSDDATSFPAGTPLTLTNLVDAIVYETTDPTDIQLLALLNPGQPQIDENLYNNKDIVSCSRIPNGSGGIRNTSTYEPAPPTPKAINRPLPELIWNTSTFNEAFVNNGSITNFLSIELNDLIFSSYGIFTSGIEYTVANVPAGLTVEINVLNDTIATVSLVGNAVAHLNINDVNNLTITFLDAAYNGLSSAFVIGNSKNNIIVDFFDNPPPTLVWDNNLFTEANTNNGSISDTINLRLYSETFTVNSGNMVQATHYSVNNVPAGLSVQIEATSDTTAIITLPGNAINHNVIDNINNLSVTFLDVAFTGGVALNIADYNNDSLEIQYLDPFYQDLTPTINPSDTIYICSNCPTCNPDIYIHNNGPTTLLQNDSIIISYIYAPLTNPIIDTIILSSDLLPNDSILFTPVLNITQMGIYSFSFNVYSNSDNNPINDTAFATIFAYQVSVDLGGINDTILVTNYPHILDAGTELFPLTYFWSDITTTQTNSISADGWYSVTVTDIRGCTATDSVYVIQNSNFLDLTIEINPSDTVYICNNCPCNYPEFLIINNGPNPAYQSDTIILNYIYSPFTAPIADTLILSSDLIAGDTLIYNPAMNITQTGIYSIQAYIYNVNDFLAANDTAYSTINAYQISVDLGGINDTLIVNYFPFSLDAGSCASPFGCNYAWSTAETTQAIDVVTDSWYFVTVSDSHGCSATDSVYVLLNPNLTDLSIEISPSDTVYICNNCSCNYPHFLIINNGPNTLLQNDSILISYLHAPLSTPTTETYVLTSDLLPTDTLDFIPSMNISQMGYYQLQASIYNFNNTNNLNDTAYSNIYAYNLTVDLGGINDTITVTDWPSALSAGNCNSPFTCSYLWSTSSTFNYIGIMANGWYSVTVTNNLGCTATDAVYVYRPDGINEISEINGIKVYPNPAKNKVNIEVNLKNQSEVTFGLYSVNGQILNESKRFCNNLINESFDVSDISSGIYYLRIATNENVRFVKLVVQ